MSNWEVITYDVWGNEDDGFEVNQAFTTGRVIEVCDDEDNDSIVEGLINSGEFHAGVVGADIDVDGDEHVIYINDAKTFEPILELHRTDNESTGALQ
jgi:hypothetical protein